MKEPCQFCHLLQEPQSNPTFIAEFQHSVAFLNFDQDGYLGASMLILKEHHEHLHLTPLILQESIVPELTNLTTALLKAFGGFRANHQSLGNQVAHVHWHIAPRYPGDRNAGFAPQHIDQFKKLPEDEYRQMAVRIRAALD